MSFLSIGDLAQGYALRQQNSVLKQQMQRLSQELASGLTSDVTEKLSGDLLRLSDVQHKLEMSDSYVRGAEQGRFETSVMQLALETLQSSAEKLSSTAISFGSSAGAVGIDVFADDARGTLGTMISALNTDAGGRSLFAGDEVATAPIVSTGDFLAAIQSAVAGAVNAAGLTLALDTFFSSGGGFETLIYQGGNAARNAYQLGDGESVTLDLRADDPAFRAILKQVSIAALLDDPGVTLTSAEQFDLASQMGIDLLSSQELITDIRADLGFAESRIDRAATRLAAEMTSLKLVQTELLTVNPYDTASELETVQVRLETLYAITSRMSRLNLVNYL